MSFLDLTGIKANSSAPLKPGVYTVKVTNAEVKETAKKDGKFIAVKFEVTAPETDKGRVVMHRFNIENKTPKAQEIGLAELKTMLLCSGHQGEKLDSVTELVGKVLAIKTKVDKDKNGLEWAGVKAFMMPQSQSSQAGSTQAKAGF